MPNETTQPDQKAEHAAGTQTEPNGPGENREAVPNPPDAADFAQLEDELQTRTSHGYSI